MNNVIQHRAATWIHLGEVTCPGVIPFCFTRFSLRWLRRLLLTALEFTGALIELLLAASLVAAVMPVAAATSRCALLTLIVLVWVARFLLKAGFSIRRFQP